MHNNKNSEGFRLKLAAIVRATLGACASPNIKLLTHRRLSPMPAMPYKVLGQHPTVRERLVLHACHEAYQLCVNAFLQVMA